MNDRIEVRIPAPLTDALLRFAAEQELSVEEIVESVMRNYMEGRMPSCPATMRLPPAAFCSRTVTPGMPVSV